MKQLAAVPICAPCVILSACPQREVSRVTTTAIWPVLACLSALLTVGCSSKAQTASSAGGGAGRGRGVPSVAVSTAVAVQKSMPVTFRSVGNVEAFSTVEVHSPVLGQVMTVNFKEGDDVTEGQLLFTLDPRPFQTTLDQAVATLAKDTVTARNAEALRSRNELLVKQGLVAQSDYDTLAANAASLTVALQADSAEVDAAKLQLQYTKITSPVAGRTGALLVHQGSLIRANDTADMVVINQVSPVYVSFAVAANMLEQIRSAHASGALPVHAGVAGTTGPPSAGLLTFVDNSVDPGTDTIRLKATFPNTDHRLWPGQFVEVTVELAQDPNAIVVPAQAVQPSQQGTFVFIVKPDHTVEMRPVTVARTSGNDSVIAKGVAVGETVVTDGQLALVPGAHVSVKPPVGGGQAPS